MGVYDNLIDRVYPPADEHEAAVRRQVREALRQVEAEQGINLGTDEMTDPATQQPPSPEERNRARAQEALQKREERQRLDQLARAYLSEELGYTEADLEAMSQTERLIEAGVDYSGETNQQRRARELREYDAKCLADPAFMEAELEKKRLEEKARKTAGIDALARRHEEERARQAEWDEKRRSS